MLPASHLYDFQLYPEEMTVHLMTFQAPEESTLQRNHPGINARFVAVKNKLGNHKLLLTSLQRGLSSMQSGISLLPQMITTDMMRGFASGVTSWLNSQDNSSPEQQETTTFDSVQDNSHPPFNMGPRQLAMPPGTPAALCIDGAEMNPCPQSATEIYEQYYGIGEEFSGQPIEGGFAKLEEVGNNWKDS